MGFHLGGKPGREAGRCARSPLPRNKMGSSFESYVSKLDEGTRMGLDDHLREQVMYDMVLNDSVEDLAPNEAEVSIDS